MITETRRSSNSEGFTATERFSTNIGRSNIKMAGGSSSNIDEGFIKNVRRSNKNFIPGRSRNNIGRSNKNKRFVQNFIRNRPKILNLCQLESDSEQITTFVQYLKSLIPSELKDLPMISGILFSLSSFIIVIFHYINDVSKRSIPLLVTTFGSLISNCLAYMMKDCEDSISDLIEASPTVVNELIQPIKIVKDQKQEFIDMVVSNGLNAREIIMAYKDLEDPKFVLPGITPPIRFPFAIRPRILDFSFGQQFLVQYWDKSKVEIEKYYRMIKMQSLEPSEENIHDDDIILNDCQNETSFKSLEGILSKLLVIICYIGETLIEKKKFSLTHMLQLMRSANEIEAVSKDLQGIYNMITGKESEDQKLSEQLTYYIDEFNTFLKTPNYKFARSPRILKNFESIIKDFESFYNSLNKDQKSNASSVHGLYISANSKVHNYYSNEVMSLSRQEPFIVCFRGNPGIGKTQMVRGLMRKLALEHFKISPTNCTIEITPEDKYWPPLGGQEMAFFDDSLGKKDIKEDLLWNSIKGICSPAFFNCAGAAITNKVNPFSARIIFTTTNTSYEDMATRVTTSADASTWEAYCRRTIHIDVSWKSKNEPNPSYSYDNKDYSHLNYDLWTFRNGKLQKDKTIQFSQLYQDIIERESRLTTEFSKHLLSYSVEAQSSKSHYSIVFHGRQGQGKSHMLSQIGNLGLSLNLPVYTYSSISELPTKQFKQRVICVLDDIVTPGMKQEDEVRIMEFYNHILVDSSIIVFGTNVSPSNYWPSISLDNLINQRKLNFYNEGLIRRMGYQGIFKGVPMPCNSTEIFVSNMKYYMFKENCITSLLAYKNKRTQLAYTAIIMMILSWFCLPVIFVPILLGYYLLTKHEFEIVSEQKLMKQLYNQINEYYSSKAGAKIVSVNPLPSFPRNPNLIIRANNSASFLQVEKKADLDKHIFTSLETFYASDKDWKIYMPNVCLRKMTQNIERFIINEVTFDQNALINIVKRYAPLFKSLEMDPVFDVKFNDIGSLAYFDNVIYKSFDTTSTTAQCDLQMIDSLPYVVIDQNLYLLQTFLFDLDSILKSYLYEDRIAISQFYNSTEFRTNKVVSQMIKNKVIQDQKNLILCEAKIAKDKFNNFLKTPFGLIAKILVGLLTAHLTYKLLKSLFSSKKNSKSLQEKVRLVKKKRDYTSGSTTDTDSDEIESPLIFCSRKKSRKGNPKLRNFDSDDDRTVESRKKSRKGNPKLRSFDSDDDKIQQSRKKSRKGNPKLRNFDSDDDRCEKEDVMTKKSMNDFDSLKKYIDVAHEKTRKNLAIIYIKTSDDEILDTEPSAPICYGLFIKNNMLVTVAHVSEEENKNTLGLRNRLYVGFDGTNQYFRLHRIFKYHTRDLAVYQARSLKTQFPDISKLFFSQKDLEDDTEYNSALERFGSNKNIEFHTSSMTFCSGPDVFNGGKLGQYGVAVYGSFGIKLTTGGDCGLPYYCVERDPKKSNKVFGIHCMGNKEGISKTIGICAVIFKEDIEEWTKRLIPFSKQMKKNCCDYKELTIEFDDYPKCENHQIVWHKIHDSTPITFYEELQHFLKFNPNFEGGIIKNSGILYGTEHHSHTQFLPNIEVCEYDVGKIIKIQLSELKKNVKDCDVFIHTSILPETSLRNYVGQIKTSGNDFRIRAQRFRGKKEWEWKISHFSLTNTIETTMEKHIRSVVTFPSNFGAPLYVKEDVANIFINAQKNRERGKMEDVPYMKNYHNETVKVIGSFTQSKSHIPSNKYKLSPFSNLVKDLIPISKMPCVYDVNLIPDEFKSDIIINNYGEHCQRSTLSMAWAHPIYGDKQKIREVGDMFISKIKTHYAGLRILTDEEVLEGLKDSKWTGYLNGMELDTSIGFTMKELFYVTKKSDVLGKTEQGKYFWKENPASEYLQEMYADAKELVAEGKKFANVFLEMLKMEKLKLSKIYRGRTFVAEDILGVLMERRILGMLAAKAYKCDPECGIGSDPDTDFNKIYTTLSKFKNMFAVDYNNYDRSVPAEVMLEIKRELKLANPHMANEIEAMMSTLIERIQISGNTFAEIFGGLPSGCFDTAPLNSLYNDFIVFYACYWLGQEIGVLVTWKLFNENVVRYYYGDDGIISVSDEWASWFNRASISAILKQDFGMTMNSSNKDGEIGGFDTWEDASWISRFFRKLGKYPIYVGALKKISIEANFHYISSLELSHIATLFERAQYEASKWEPEFFNQVQEAIRRCIEKQPKLARMIELPLQSTYHDDIFERSIPKSMVWEKSWYDMAIEEENSGKISSEEKEQTAPLEEIKNTSRTRNPEFRYRYYFSAQYFKQVIKSNKMNGQYQQTLNMKFQDGIISKPSYTLEGEGPDNDKKWICKLEFIYNSHPQFFTGFDRSKQLAKEDAAYQACKTLFGAKPLKERQQQIKDLVREIVLERQMNVSRQVEEQVPMPTLSQKDMSVVSDGGLFTNVDAFANSKLVNTDAIALDNPAGSGAPFSKHTSCYKIYQRWSEKNTTISPALTSGTEIFRLSLDPNSWPLRLREYVLFHQSILPALDIVVAIAGAAGSIGWITSGWVRDASNDKQYTLDDLQQVASETMNMNGTQIFKIHLTDVRKSGLYRQTQNDPEPYPGIIFMVDQAVTNVQRNDGVNYPVRVMARLAPDCLLMEPFGTGSIPIEDKFNLGSYMLTDQFDALIGSSSTTSNLQIDINLDDKGLFSKLNFIPEINAAHSIASFSSDSVQNFTGVIAFTDDETPSADFLSQLSDAASSAPDIEFGGVVREFLYFGYGSVKATLPMIGTVYQIPEQLFTYKAFTYSITTMYLQNEGCILEAKLLYTINDKFFICNRSKTGIKQDDILFDFEENRDTSMAYFYKDPDHNNNVVGDEGYMNAPVDDHIHKVNFKLSYKTTLKEPKTYIQTGNSIPSANLPNGLKSFTFIRQGTTSTDVQNNPFATLDNPIIRNAYQALNIIVEERNWNALGADLYVDDLNLGQIGYQNDIFFVRTEDYKMIKAGISSKNVFLKNLYNLQNVQGLTNFQTSNFAQWSNSKNVARKRTIILDACEKQSAILAGGIQGIGQGMNSWIQNSFNSRMLDKVLANQRGIVDANNAALAERARQAFERSMELKGYGSASMQHGQAGPQLKEQGLNSHVVQNFVSGGTQFNHDGIVTLDPSKVSAHYIKDATEFNPEDIVKMPSREIKHAEIGKNQKYEIPFNANKITLKDGSTKVSTMNPEAPEFIPGIKPTMSVLDSKLNPMALAFQPQSANQGELQSDKLQ